ncbi:MAG: alginate O-acetyltransferase complex protein AlgI [Arenicella sp.]|jgi:alginate O-acetyltransferase complex protein AlgI
MLEQFLYNESQPLLFTNGIFWVYFGFLILFYTFNSQKINLRNYCLLAFSIYFYYLSSGYYFLLLIFSTIVDYFIGGAIFNSSDQKKRKWLVGLSVFVNLSVLAYFKYAYFFTDLLNTTFLTDLRTTNYLALGLNSLFGTDADILKIALPVGISFYTFQTISYSVDIYRGDVKPVKNILDFAFFVSFFPQLVAGPIVRASDFVPQIYKPFKLKEQEYSRAIYLILAGLFKKIVISDYISLNFVDRVFAEPSSYSGFENLIATYGYAIQIYCDFSGYTDIAIGVSLLLGFRLPLNFNSPYKANSITDFWRRWHISLSTWLRDYLYISMGGNRKGRVKTYIFLFITMFLGGLWHGANIRFIIWGALHGVALAIHKLWMELIGSKGKKAHPIYNFLMGVLTFHFVCFCWIFFRANDMEKVQQVLYQMAFAFHPELILEMLTGYAKIFAVILLGFLLHWLPYNWKTDLQNHFRHAPDFAKAMVIVLLALLLFQLKTSESQPFIYFQF